MSQPKDLKVNFKVPPDSLAMLKAAAEVARSRIQASEDLAGQVAALQERQTRTFDLLGEVLATLRLPENQKLFDDMPPEWHKLIEQWVTRFHQLQEGEQ